MNQIPFILFGILVGVAIMTVFSAPHIQHRDGRIRSLQDSLARCEAQKNGLMFELRMQRGDSVYVFDGGKVVRF
jgi:hypothetical protein